MKYFIEVVFVGGKNTESWRRVLENLVWAHALQAGVQNSALENEGIAAKMWHRA